MIPGDLSMENNIFNELSEAIINSLTHFINNFSGLLQIIVYFTIGIIFFYALVKCGQALRSLARFNFARLDEKGVSTFDSLDDRAPLAVVAASFFCKTKKHYLLERKNDLHSSKTIPPDGFIRDAAFQYSERYFEEKFLEPISLTANLMPSLGFIGTIIGMVVHFLSNSGSLNSNLTVVGIATALYTTFIGLVCYTILEFMLKVLSSLGRRRIDEGLAAVAGLRPVSERKAA
jgi:biopolymer transport protein ExbB/TolQ